MTRNSKKKLKQSMVISATLITLITTPFLALSAETKISKTKSLNSDEKIVHVLNRLGYGPRPGDVERVKQLGLEKYIELQLNPERIDDKATEAKLTKLETLNMQPLELARAYPLPQVVKKAEEKGNEEVRTGIAGAKLTLDEDNIKGRPGEILEDLSQQHLLRAVYSERQLYQVMVDFWTNHFNVFWAKGADRYLLTSHQQETIHPHAMGNFGKLLTATAKSPAMLFYLDNWLSSDPKAVERFIAEQQAKRQRRDQLLRMRKGRFGRLNPPDPRIATTPLPKPPNANNPSNAAQAKRRVGLNENYARELMELHTMGVDGGYTQQDVTDVARCFTGWTIKRDGDKVEFNYNERLHDEGEKVVLGVKIPAGGGQRDGEKVLDILLHHPATARFIATKLTRHFVADEPPQTLVTRVATSFTKTDGDIRAMLKTILTSSEFYAAENYRAKVKSPLALIASALRAADAETDASRQLLFYLARMGQPLFLCQPPTGYGDTAEKWVSSASLVERLNFALALCEGRIMGTTPKVLRATPASLDGMIDLLLHTEVSETTRQALEKELGKQALTADRMPKLAGLLLGSPEFQKM